MELFGIHGVVVDTRLCVFVKDHKTVHERVNYMTCKSYCT